MRKHERTAVYKRDLLARGGRQYILPWGPGKTISTIQAADRLGVCHDTVRSMCEEGEIQGWPIREKKGSPWRVSVESVDDYIAKKIATYDINDPDATKRTSLPNTQNATARQSR